MSEFVHSDTDYECQQASHGTANSSLLIFFIDNYTKETVCKLFALATFLNQKSSDVFIICSSDLF